MLAQDLLEAVTAQNRSLKQWLYFGNGHIILQTALKFTGCAPVPSFQLCNLYSKDVLLRDNLPKLFQKLNLVLNLGRLTNDGHSDTERKSQLTNSKTEFFANPAFKI